jgi:hypothetical protein
MASWMEAGLERLYERWGPVLAGRQVWLQQHWRHWVLGLLR